MLLPSTELLDGTLSDGREQTSSGLQAFPPMEMKFGTFHHQHSAAFCQMFAGRAYQLPVLSKRFLSFMRATTM
jgi:hypothetical protein